MRLFICLLMCISFIIQCSAPKKSTAGSIIINFDRFESGEMSMSNDEKLSRIIAKHKNINSLIVKLGNRTYDFDYTIFIGEHQGSLKLEGKKMTIFRLSKPFLNARAKQVETRLEKDVKRFSKEISIDHSGIEVNSLVGFQSDDVVEVAWKYKEADILKVSRIAGQKLFFTDSINFNFEVGETYLQVYSPSLVSVHNIQFELKDSISYVLSVRGSGVEFTNCVVRSKLNSNLPVFASLYYCEDIRIRNCSLQGNIVYGFLMNSCRNIKVDDIHAVNCLHPIVPAYWTSNTDVDGFTGIGSLIDAHPSFHVSYKNVDIKKGIGYWNCRAFDVVLENCTIEAVSGIRNESLYLGVVGLNDEYAFLYDEYDVFCKNVKWVYQDQQFNGLHVHKCRDFIVDSCTTHAVSTGVPIRRFEVSHSQVGRVYGADSNFKVTQSTFNRKLQNSPETKPPLSCSYGGHLRIEDCHFIGYDQVHLFDYIQSANTEFRFINCDFNHLKGFVRKSYRPREEYKNIHVQNAKESQRIVSLFHDMPFIHSAN